MNDRSRPAPTLTLRDLYSDAVATIRSRLGRSLGVGIAAALGIATLVGAMQLASSADAHVAERIQRERPEVLVARPSQAGTALIDDIREEQLSRLNDLRSVIATSSVQRVSTLVRVNSGARPGQDVALAAVEGDLAASTRLTLTGRSFQGGELKSGAHVAMVGRRVASSMSLPSVKFAPIIWINGTGYLVVGIINDSELAPDLIDQVAIPRITAVAELGDEPLGGFSSVLYVRAHKDAVPRLSEDLALWLRPDRPESWRVEVPRTSIDLASAISSDVRNLSFASGGLVLFIGAVGIGNAMLRSVYMRVQEIGLRRILGARARQIVGLLLIEAAVIGFIAGLIGTSAGYVVAAGVAQWNSWPIVANPALPFGSVILALAAALAGAVVPTRVAIKVSPAEALRRD